MNQPLTTCQMAEQLLRFEPGTPCVVHMWLADDFEDVAPELKPDEVLPQSPWPMPRSMRIRVSAGISCATAPTPSLPHGSKKNLPDHQKTGGGGTTRRSGNESNDRTGIQGAAARCGVRC